MDEFATDRVQALIATARVAEMKAKGWRVLGRGEEGSLLMEGPLVGGSISHLGTLAADLFEDLVATAIARADTLDRMRKAA